MMAQMTVKNVVLLTCILILTYGLYVPKSTRRAALVTFQITGNPDTAQNRVAPALAATAAVQRAHPQLFVGEVGTASTLKAVNKLVADDFHQAEATSLPITLLILVVAFGALVPWALAEDA